MGAFSRSWQITKLSFSVINKDRELLLFPLLSGIFSIIFIILMLFPTIISLLMGFDSSRGIFFYVSIFIVYFGIAFITTFFNVCTVYTTAIRFGGNNATFKQSLKFAFSRIYLIFLWSLVSATVGLLLRILDTIADRMGTVGSLIMNILISILGMAWSILTIFVVPGLVYHNLTPFDAIKKSVETLKKTWGESLIRYIGLGIVQGIAMVVAIIIGGGILLLTVMSGSLILISIGLFVFVSLLLFIILLFQVANSVFNTALFVYADSGQVPNGFNEELMKNAFTEKPSKKFINFK